MGETEEIQHLETRLNELRVAYEKYFAGVEKIEPARLRDEVQRIVRRVGTLYIGNTGLKFKRDSIIAQFNTLTQHWNRILKQIEDGTYQRDVFKMRLKDRERGGSPAPTGAPRGTPQAAPPPAETEKGGSAPPGKSPAHGAPGEPSAKKSGEYDSVYRSLVAAKKRLGEPTENISYNALEWSLKKEAEAIKKKFKASRVDFTVEVKDGKPVIKAVPVK
ncbi:MAG: hypothetical protein JW765_01555 [Deltaproteobacteria bacterium]|nr:hypothetical protein [Candidatus Zymogenaceae bacterium]